MLQTAVWISTRFRDFLVTAPTPDAIPRRRGRVQRRPSMPILTGTGYGSNLGRIWCNASEPRR